MRKFLFTAIALLTMTVSASAAYMCNSNSDYTNVRTGPSAQDYRIKDQIGNNHNVSIISVTENAAGYEWYRIRYNSMRYGSPSVETGWVDASSVCE